MGCLIGLGLLLFAGKAEAKLRVVGTLPDFASIASEIGGDRVATDSLIAGTEDPHFVDAKPSHVLRVHRADLLICIGMGLESGWLPVLLTQARNGNSDAAAAIVAVETHEITLYERYSEFVGYGYYVARRTAD